MPKPYRLLLLLGLGGVAQTCARFDYEVLTLNVGAAGASGDCPENVCQASSCSDSSQNQGEAAIDCGGPNCAPCPTCSDGDRNQDETGIDCGGSVCPACVSCSDGAQNQDETGVDCGG